MKVVVSGGGTAGHVNPALALADELIASGHEVVYIGTPDGMEATLARNAGLDYWPLPAAGYDRARLSTLLTSSAEVLTSAHKAQRHFREIKPDVVVGFGGYVSLPVGMAGLRCGIPVVAHEQNSAPGLTNRYLAKHGAHMATTFPMTTDYLACPADHIHLVGNPVRRSVVEGDRERGRALFNIPEEATFLLVFGGSLGAQHINEAVLACRDALMDIPNLYVVHSTGRQKYEEVLAEIGDGVGERWQVLPFIEQMGDALKASDAVISRAGSTSLMEIAVTGAAALLVPFPHATDDHQTKNASEWVEAGACSMIADSQLDTLEFRERLVEFVSDAPARAEMGKRVKAFAKPDAARELAKLVCDVAMAQQR